MEKPRLGDVIDGYIFNGGDPADQKNWTAFDSYTPKAGDVVDGFEFKGGDPADQGSWKPYEPTPVVARSKSPLRSALSGNPDFTDIVRDAPKSDLPPVVKQENERIKARVDQRLTDTLAEKDAIKRRIDRPGRSVLPIEMGEAKVDNSWANENPMAAAAGKSALGRLAGLIQAGVMGLNQIETVGNMFDQLSPDTVVPDYEAKPLSFEVDENGVGKTNYIAPKLTDPNQAGWVPEINQKMVELTSAIDAKKMEDVNWSDLDESTDWLAVKFASTTPDAAMSLAAVLNPSIATAYLTSMGTSSAGSQYARLRAEGVDSGTAMIDGILNGLVETGTERMGLDALSDTVGRIVLREGRDTFVKKLAGLGTMMVMNSAIEGAEEGAATLGQGAVDFAVTGKPMDTEGLAESVLVGALGGAGTGAAATAAFNSQANQLDSLQYQINRLNNYDQLRYLNDEALANVLGSANQLNEIRPGAVDALKIQREIDSRKQAKSDQAMAEIVQNRDQMSIDDIRAAALAALDSPLTVQAGPAYDASVLPGEPEPQAVPYELRSKKDLGRLKVPQNELVRYYDLIRNPSQLPMDRAFMADVERRLPPETSDLLKRSVTAAFTMDFDERRKLAETLYPKPNFKGLSDEAITFLAGREDVTDAERRALEAELQRRKLGAQTETSKTIEPQNTPSVNVNAGKVQSITMDINQSGTYAIRGQQDALEAIRSELKNLGISSWRSTNNENGSVLTVSKQAPAETLQQVVQRVQAPAADELYDQVSAVAGEGFPVAQPVAEEQNAQDTDAGLARLTASINRQIEQDRASGTQTTARAVDLRELTEDEVRAHPAQGSLEAARAVGRAFGKRVVFVRDRAGQKLFFDGVYNQGVDSNTVYVDAGSSAGAHRVTAHEILHALRSQAPDVYKVLERGLRPVIDKKAGADHLIGRNYGSQQAIEQDLADNDGEMQEELVADVFSDVLLDPAALDELLGKMQPSTAQKFLTRVRVMLDKAIAAVKGLGSDTYADLAKARQHVIAAAKEYARRVEAGEIQAAEELEDDNRFARKPTSDIGHKRRGTDGSYIGAPDWISSPASLAVLRRKLKSLALEGESGRFWYERSSKAVLDLVGGDKVDAEKFVGLLAIYSQGTEVGINLGFALEAYYQWKAGLPIHTGRFPTAQTKKAEPWLKEGKDWGGIKTNNFYADLMEEIDPKKVDADHATMDMWMALAFDYGDKKLDQGPKYNFAKREIKRLADELGWKPHQVQAAIWTSIKTRVEGTEKKRNTIELAKGIGQKSGNAHAIVKGREYDHFRLAHKLGMEMQITPEEIAAKGFDFADALNQRVAQLSWEATPSVTGGDIPGIHEASTEAKMEYLVEISKVLAPNGRDQIAEMIGLHTPPTVFGYSAWEGAVGAGAQSFLPVPITGQGKDRAVLPVARDMLNLYSAIKGYVLKQDAVVWHIPVYGDALVRANGFELSGQAPFTEGEFIDFYQAIIDEFGTTQLAPGYTQTGARVLNFEDNLDNQAFQSRMRDVVKRFDEMHPDALGGRRTMRAFRSDGDYIGNDWKESLNGEDYRSRFSGSGRPDLQGRADDLRARVKAVNQDFAKRYGWGDPDREAPGVRFKRKQLSVEEGRKLTALYAEVLKRVGEPIFSYPRSDKTTLEGVAEEVSKGQIKSRDVSFYNDDGRQMDALSIPVIRDDGTIETKDAFVTDDGDELWINIAGSEEGAGGSRVYSIVGNYAYNTGKVFIGDPDGITYAGMARRLQNMLSLALKFGTTEFMRPHPDQLRLFKDYGLDWKKGDDQYNLQSLLLASYNLTLDYAPEIADVDYNFTTGQFEKAGEPLDESYFQDLADRAHSSLRSGAPGRRSLKVAGLTGTLLRMDRGGVDRIRLESPEGVRADRPLERILYKRKQTETPEFKAWFGNSKVVDENGAPLLVYHGTSSAFTEFGNNRSAHFFTESPEMAEGYGPSLVQAYLRITNPASYDDVVEAARAAGWDENALEDEIAGIILSDNEVVERLKAKGFDGWIGEDDPAIDDYDDLDPQMTYVVFGPTQIKSAIGNNGQFDPANPDIRFKRKSPFYSQLATALEAQPDRIFNQPGKQVALWLQSNASKLGVKKDEIEWTGITDWLQTQAKPSKGDVLAFLEANGVQVRDVISDEQVTKADIFDGAKLTLGGLTYRVDGTEDGYQLIDPYGELIKTERTSADMAYYANSLSAKPKYSSYKVPGGTDYRELLLTLPGQDPRTPEQREFFHLSQRMERTGLGGADLERLHTLATSMTAEERAAAAVAPEPMFSSAHFGEPNILAHVRFDTRQDAEGKKVLFVHEIQSDWGQEGKKKGFRKAGNRGISDDEFEEFVQLGRLQVHSGEQERRYEELRSLNESPASNAAPSAPFVTDTKSWVALALKRIIAYAAETGHDKVALINGKQAADLYSLAQQVDVLYAGMASDGQYLIGADSKAESDVINQKVSREDLPNLVGKELAEKIINDVKDESTNVQYSGLDLEIGGSGMKAFYDQIVPQIANDVLKRIGGGKVGTVTFKDFDNKRTDMIRSGMPAPAGSERAKYAGEQLGFEITPAIREKVAAEGLPLFARKPGQATFNGPDTSLLDNLVYKFQDRHIDTRRVIEEIKTTQGAIQDWANPYLQEELYHGRTAKRVSDFLDDELRPLLRDMQLRKVTIEELEEYLWARHAPEANAHIAAINPDLPDGGSGMTDQEAADYMANLPPAKRTALEALAKKVDAMIGRTRQLTVDYQLENQDTVNRWAATYQFYVPLHREDVGSGPGVGQGFSVRGPASKRRTGSTRAVVDILGNIAMQRERTIVRGEKNRVALALVAIAAQNPAPDFWKINVAPKIKYVDERTNQVAERVDPLFKSKDNVIVGRLLNKTTGQIEEHYVIFNDFNERALRMAHALKNLDMDQLGGFLGTVGKFTRYFASVNTQYNPIFGIKNFLRDTQGALFNLSTTPIAGKQKEVGAYTVSALTGIYRDIRAIRKGKHPTSSWAKLWEEYQQEGGQTGYRDAYRTSADREQALHDELKAMASGKLKNALKAKVVFEWLSDYNETMENAVRLAAYKVALDQGLTKQQAASIGKNLTVNFNRKGQASVQLGALYAFFNASVQGTARLGETLTGPKGRMIIGGGILLGVLQALAMLAAGMGEDDPPEFVRERNIIIPLFNEKQSYLSIPMPLGFNILPNIGRILSEWSISGFKKTPERFAHLMGLMLDTFDPLGGSSSIMQWMTPTALDPVAALAENEDWTGRRITREDMNSNKPTPGFTRAKDTATTFSKELSYYLNLASGGTKYTAGMFSPTPDQIDYLIGQLTGGVGREISKADQTINALVTGEDLPKHKIPLAGGFYGEATGKSSESEAYYKTIRRFNDIDLELKGRREDGESVKDYLAEHPEAKYRVLVRAAERRVTQLNKQRRDLIERGAPRERVRLIEQQITATMKRLNDRVGRE